MSCSQAPIPPSPLALASLPSVRTEQGPSAKEVNRDSTAFERARAEWGRAAVSHRGKVGGVGVWWRAAGRDGMGWVWGCQVGEVGAGRGTVLAYPHITLAWHATFCQAGSLGKLSSLGGGVGGNTAIVAQLLTAAPTACRDAWWHPHRRSEGGETTRARHGWGDKAREAGMGTAPPATWQRCIVLAFGLHPNVARLLLDGIGLLIAFLLLTCVAIG